MDIRLPWITHRSAIATVDSPSTAGNTRDAPDDVTERKVIYMVDTDEVAITPLNVEELGISFLELRVHFNDNAGTATTSIFAARKGEKSVKMIAEIAWTAGTQTTADSTARYFAKTGTITQYWPKVIFGNGTDETNGIAVAVLDTMGYDRFWALIDALSADDNVTVEASGISER
jgi:hypothetical protein